MRRLLNAAFVPENTLHLLQSIVDTCRVCRQWTRPGPRNINSVSLHTKFNDAVQVDLVFCRDWVVLVMVLRLYCQIGQVKEVINASSQGQ